MTTLARGSRLLFATHNQGKAEEVRALLAPRGIEVVSAADLGLPIPVESGSTFAENATIKALSALRETGLTALADDSGLCIDALDGAPGVYTADWAEVEGGRDFQVAMQKAYDALSGRQALQPWTASFVSTLALAEAPDRVSLFEGRVEGELIWPLRGALGHGYDPMFVPSGSDRTFAEMSLSEKNALSHRARAFALFLEACFT